MTPRIRGLRKKSHDRTTVGYYGHENLLSGAAQRVSIETLINVFPILIYQHARD